MPKGGLEPPRVAPYAPQTYVSTNSTTSARGKIYCAGEGEGVATGAILASGDGAGVGVGVA